MLFRSIIHRPTLLLSSFFWGLAGVGGPSHSSLHWNRRFPWSNSCPVLGFCFVHRTILRNPADYFINNNNICYFYRAHQNGKARSPNDLNFPVPPLSDKFITRTLSSSSTKPVLRHAFKSWILGCFFPFWLDFTIPDRMWRNKRTNNGRIEGFG